MKKLLLLAIVLTVCVMWVAPAGAWYSACEQAAWAGWHHNGMNHACLMSVINDIIGGVGYNDGPYNTSGLLGDADNLSGYYNSGDGDDIAGSSIPGDGDDIAGSSIPGDGVSGGR